MTRTIVYRKSKVFRRLGAFALDLIMALVIFIFFLILVMMPIIKNTTSYTKDNKTLTTMKLESGIYEERNGLIYLFSDHYDYHLTQFYEKYDTLDNYNKRKEDSGLFQYSTEYNAYIEIGTDKEVQKFYTDTLKEAEKIFYKNEDVKYLADRIEAYSILMVLPSLTVASILVFLVPALIFPNRNTLGMFPFHLKVVSKKTGDIASRWQIVFKFLIFFVFEILLSMYYVGYGLLLISGIMVIFTKEKLSLSDLFCSTVVVDGMVLDAEIPENNRVNIPIEVKNPEEKLDEKE